jgi:hypothetical protein
MDATVIPPALRDRLGPDATAGLLELLAQPQPTWKTDVIEAVTDRFERRLVEETSKLRIEMAQGFAALRHETSELRQELAGTRQAMTQELGAIRQVMSQDVGVIRQAMTLDRFELLKWAFLFWVGQFFATASLAVLLVRFLKSGG